MSSCLKIFCLDKEFTRVKYSKESDTELPMIKSDEMVGFEFLNPLL